MENNKGWKTLPTSSPTGWKCENRHSCLARKLREKEETLAPLTGFKIKLQLANLFNTDLGKGKHCGTQLCPPCDGSVEEKKQDCRAINLMYKSSCTIFNAENGNIQKDDKGRSREEVYISETSISIHERSKEHLAFEVPYCETLDVVPPRGGLHGRI